MIGYDFYKESYDDTYMEDFTMTYDVTPSEKQIDQANRNYYRRKMQKKNKKADSECKNIFDAIRGYNLRMVKKYISQVNDTTGEKNFTPLHLAAKENFYEALVILIRRKANINAQDKDGNTPLHIAIQSARGDTLILRYLVSHGANTRIENKKKQNCIDLCESITKFDYSSIIR